MIFFIDLLFEKKYDCIGLALYNLAFSFVVDEIIYSIPCCLKYGITTLLIIQLLPYPGAPVIPNDLRSLNNFLTLFLLNLFILDLEMMERVL